ncbi:hypothetical protein [Bradyrhizobium sp.]|uniref:hypothetical protein n=1 Tax=Bradyrhizobium sp. TaxID=376 RepID=UPI0039E3300F
MRRIKLENPTNLRITDQGVIEIDGEIEAERATMEMDARGAATIMAALATVARVQANITKSPQDLTVLPLLDAAVESPETRDGAHLVLRSSNGLQLTYHAPLDLLTEIGALLVSSANRMRSAPPRMLS